jgi:hypothetical protein
MVVVIIIILIQSFEDVIEWCLWMFTCPDARQRQKPWFMEFFNYKKKYAELVNFGAK